ncbi:LON peptidase N-terminal domain and RING finger protein 1-like isoform X1 [Senna tora]|uniref:LON peptidase N-terminal domain and RING finger protein 1-like isoform X1 n=1 Tax=Senna tora TaxID=362788 RepID=A0A834X5L4_9FABA|nr:LON peptidase N-terminal domain and RING finger protein 1-like isoform X1 [Senna tora]
MAEEEESAASSCFTLLSTDGLDDVDDYVLANEPEDLTRETFEHVFELVQNGNLAFRNNRMEEAINFYSRANSIKTGDPVILSNRSKAYIRISQSLKQRSPSASEYNSLSGLDPTTHAELGLKDAEKLVDIQSNSVKSYILKANALFLLEKYDMARDVILSGLQVNPLSKSLQASLSNLKRASASLARISTHEQAERTDDFDCTLCLKLLYEPVTTPCGHSFCRSCLFQSMDRGNRCPLCRTVLFISPRTCSVSVTLKNIIQKNFPEEYAERKLENDNLTNPGFDLIPLFVMDVVIPCQKFPLHIFEPRYRLMIRRIMEGNRRMGMVIIDSATNSLAEFACEVEITECEPLPDGRFYIELQEITFNAAESARSWIRRAKEAAGPDQRRLERLLNVEAMMPPLQDPERFSFWLATLSNRRPSEKLDLLRLTDTKEWDQYNLL